MQSGNRSTKKEQKGAQLNNTFPILKKNYFKVIKIIKF